MKRLAAAMFFGSISALAYAPLDIVPMLWIGLLGLIFLVQGTENTWQAFLAGWCFEFAFFVASLSWMVAMMFADVGQFWWQIPLAGFGLPAVLALSYGYAAAGARAMGLRGAPGMIGFALLWFLAGYARGNLFTGFPWNIEGYVWADFLPVLQITSVVGIYGLTLLMLVVMCLPACLAEKNLSAGNRWLVTGALVAFLFLTGWGEWRLLEAPDDVVPNVRLRLVLPEIGAKIKIHADEVSAIFSSLLELSSAPAVKPVTAIIWPEAAAIYRLAEDAQHRLAVAAVAPPNGAVITGILRSGDGPNDKSHVYNSVVAIDHAGRIEALYDKFHLVPFGEYNPFYRFVPVRALATEVLDMSIGPGPRTFHIGGIPPFSPIVCYEIVDRKDPPQVLINFADDGWFGHTPGPYQAFAIARVRPVEEGIPMVRDADGGISAIVDPYGRIKLELGLDHRGFIDGDLPQALPRKTIFARFDEKPLWIIFSLLVTWVFIARRADTHRPK